MLCCHRPGSAARLSLAQDEPALRQLVLLILNTADEQALALVGDIGQRFPQSAGVATWLYQCPEWKLALVREVRREREAANGWR